MAGAHWYRHGKAGWYSVIWYIGHHYGLVDTNCTAKCTFHDQVPLFIFVTMVTSQLLSSHKNLPDSDHSKLFSHVSHH